MSGRHKSTSAALAAALGIAAAGATQGLPSTDVYVCSLATDDGGALAVTGCRNVSDRDGYDNQPAFLPDGEALLYTSHRSSDGDDAAGQTDIYRYDMKAATTERLTDTAESEYSPTPLPSASGFSVVRVEADGTQRLWRFGPDGEKPRLLLADVKPVGYHAWLDADTVALFVLGEPHELRVARLGQDGSDKLAADIGRSLHKVPGETAVSFVAKADRTIRTMPAGGGEAATLVKLLPEREDYVWMGRRTLLMGSASKLFRADLDQEPPRWVEVADLKLAGVRGISRLAVSRAGDRLALVGKRATPE